MLPEHPILNRYNAVEIDGECVYQPLPQLSPEEEDTEAEKEETEAEKEETEAENVSDDADDGVQKLIDKAMESGILS